MCQSPCDRACSRRWRPGALNAPCRMAQTGASGGHRAELYRGSLRWYGHVAWCGWVSTEAGRIHVAAHRVLRYVRGAAGTTVADVRMWAFCIGFRNLLAGIGAIIGLVILWTGDVAVGRAVVVTALATSPHESRHGHRGSARTLATPRSKHARHPRIEPAAAGRPHRSRHLTQETEFLRSATSLQCGVVRLQTARVIAHRDRE